MTRGHGGRLVGRDGVLVLASAFFYMAATMISNALIASFVGSLGAASALVGIIGSMMSVMSLACRPVFGNLADRLPKALVSMVGAAVLCASTVGYVVAMTSSQACVLRVVSGVGYAMCSVCVSTWFAEMLPADRIGAGMGVFGLMNALAMSVGPAAGVALSGMFGVRMALLFAGVLGGCSFVSMLLASRVSAGEAAGRESVAGAAPAEAAGEVRSDDSPETGAPCHDEAGQAPSQDEPARPRRRLPAIADVRAVPAAVEVALFTTPYMVVQTYLVDYVADRSLGVSVGLYFTVYAVVLLVLRTSLRNAFDSWKFGTFAIASALAETGALACLALMRSDVGLFASAALMAAGYGVMCSVCQSSAVRLVGPGGTGLANGTYYMGLDCGMILGPLLGGALYDAIDLAWLFPSFVPLMVLAVVVYLALRHRLDG